jgi:hypothetical protein
MVESNTRINAGTGDHRTPEEIQRDMECTRQRIDQSVNSLEAKLTPSNLIAGAERWLTGGRVSETGPLKEHVTAFIRGYPLPSALVGAAAAWVVIDRFLASNRACPPGQGGLTHGHAMGGNAIRDAGRAVSHGVHAVGDAAMGAAGAVKHGVQAIGSGIGSAASATGHAASAVKHGVYDAADTIGHVAGSAGHTVGHTVSGTARRAGHLAESIGHTAGQVGHRVGHTVSGAAKDTRQTLTKTYDEYPIGMGLVAAGLGLACGLLIPHTRAEDKALGHVADKAKDKAGRLGQEVKREVKEQTRELAEAGKSVVREIKSEIKPDRQESGMGGLAC